MSVRLSSTCMGAPGGGGGAVAPNLYRRGLQQQPLTSSPINVSTPPHCSSPPSDSACRSAHSWGSSLLRQRCFRHPRAPTPHHTLRPHTTSPHPHHSVQPPQHRLQRVHLLGHQQRLQVHQPKRAQLAVAVLAQQRLEEARRANQTFRQRGNRNGCCRPGSWPCSHRLASLQHEGRTAPHSSPHSPACAG